VTSTRSKKLCLAQQPDADDMLSRDPFALLVGMLLDQQIPMVEHNGGLGRKRKLSKDNSTKSLS